MVAFDQATKSSRCSGFRVQGLGFCVCTALKVVEFTGTVFAGLEFLVYRSSDYLLFLLHLGLCWFSKNLECSSLRRDCFMYIRFLAAQLRSGRLTLLYFCRACQDGSKAPYIINPKS